MVVKMNRKITSKITALVLCSFILLTMLNVSIYLNIKNTIQNIDTVYKSNEQLNELMNTIGTMQENVLYYVENKDTAALMDYYKFEQIFTDSLEGLNHDVTNDKVLLLEKNIYNLSYTYIESAESALEARRAGNVSKYKTNYETTQELYIKIERAIRTLNNDQFMSNSQKYKVYRTSLNELFVTSVEMWIGVLVIDIFFILLMTRSITRPLLALTKSADQVASGNFDVAIPVVNSGDEIETLSKGFNKMIVSIRNYIEELRKVHARETRMIENELNMKNELKEAQLRYLQAQINPHFLFNTLNAGAQLAMMEGAEKTCIFIQNVADFFRYNVQNMDKVSTIRKEIELADNYIYILNVRFSGEITYKKLLNEKLLDKDIPGMILQPIVENAVNHGVRGLEREEIIEIQVYQEQSFIYVCIKDNGHGMTQRQLENIRQGYYAEEEQRNSDSGIGLQNVISRLRRYYGRDDVFRIESGGKEKGTAVMIKIPS